MGRMTALVTLWLGSTVVLGAESQRLDQPFQPGVELSYHEPLSGYQLRSEIDGVAKLGPGQPLVMDFQAFSRHFQLLLSPNASLLPAEIRQRLAEQDVHVYQGRVANAEASWARLVIHAGVPRGAVFDGRHLYSIEVPGDALMGGIDGPMIYRLADVLVQPGQLGCGIDPSVTSGTSAYESLVAELKTLAASVGPGATQNLNLGAVADFEFSENFGSSAEAALVDRFNRVDGIFSAELGVQITVAEIDIFTTDNDPFSGTESSPLLNQLASYRANDPQQRAQGLSHLFTGRDLDGTTVGVAFVGTLCNSFAGAGLSEGNRGPFTDSLIAAHEMGHNFGADHDGDPNGGCPDAPTNRLMAPSINGSNEFSQCSKDQMAVEIAAASCITPLANVDMAASLDNPTLMVLTGSDFSYGITVDNEGSEEAEDVTLAIQLPAEIDVQAAQPSTGSCNVGAGTIDCALGAVPSDSTRTVQLTLQATAPGDLNVSATVSSGNDVDLSNNLAQGTITADPAVDLVVAPVAATQVSVNASSTLDVTVRNDADLTATQVAVSFTLDAGLRANSADYPLGSCAVTGQQVDCSGGTLSANGSSQLSLAVTGLSTGQHDIDITVTSAEAELNSNDNTASATVTVQALAPASAGGGGGAILWLGLLVALLGIQAKRHP